MKTRAILFSIFTITLFALATFISIIFNTAPTTAGVIALFYSTLVITLFGCVFFVSYATNFFRYHTTPPWQATFTSLRISLIIAVTVSVLLALKSVKLLNIPTVLVFLALAITTELSLRRYVIKQPTSKRNIQI